MNWVGGARSRICKADFKSKRGQQRLQKEYFEKRRLGAINVNALGKNAKRSTTHPKESKCRISQDILDFQNLKQHIDGDVNPASTRAAFRVVNLNKKPAASKYLTNPSNRNYEHVEMPLSPVGKHSVLDLSHSPNQVENRETPHATDQIVRKQPAFRHLPPSMSTQSESDARNLHGKPSIGLPKTLQLFDKRESRYRPRHPLLGIPESSSTIELFGAPVKKPEKVKQRESMAPPTTFGVIGTKAKRKKPNPVYPQFEDRWKSNTGRDSHYPSEDTTTYRNYNSSSSSSLDTFINNNPYEVCKQPSSLVDLYESTTIPDYPCVDNDISLREAPSFHLVPSQSSYSTGSILSDCGMATSDGDRGVGSSNLFQFNSPSVSTAISSSWTTAKDIEPSIIHFGTKEDLGFSNSDYALNTYTKANISHTNDFCYSYDSKFLLDRRDVDTPLRDKLFLPTPQKFTDTCGDSRYNSQIHQNASRHRHSNHVISSSQTFHTSDSKRKKRDRPFIFRHDVAPSSGNDASHNFSSIFYSEKEENPVDDRNVHINKRLAAEWCNDTREQNSSFGSDKNPAGLSDIDENIANKRPPAFFEDNIEFSEPLQTSTPFNAPICINKQALEQDVDKQRTVTVDLEKSYPVTDLLDEMMDLEAQAHTSLERPQDELSQDNHSTHVQVNTNDEKLVEQVVANLLSKIEASCQQSYGQEAIKDPHPCPSIKPAETLSTTTSKDNFLSTSVHGNGTISQNTTCCQDSGQNTTKTQATPNGQNNLSDEIQGRKGCDTINRVSDYPLPNSADNANDFETPIKVNTQGTIDISQSSNLAFKQTAIETFANQEDRLCVETKSNSLSQNSVVVKNHSGRYAQNEDQTCHSNPVLSTFSIEQLSQKVTPRHSTVSTQTVPKQFTDTASSPIIIYTSEHDPVRDADSHCHRVEQSLAATSKSYSLRSRSKHCHEVTGREE